MNSRRLMAMLNPMTEAARYHVSGPPPPQMRQVKGLAGVRRRGGWESLYSHSYAVGPRSGRKVLWAGARPNGVSPHLLYPMKTWKDKAAFDETARKLVRMFQENFVKYEQHVDPDVRSAAPEVRIAAE